MVFTQTHQDMLDAQILFSEKRSGSDDVDGTACSPCCRVHSFTSNQDMVTCMQERTSALTKSLKTHPLHDTHSHDEDSTPNPAATAPSRNHLTSSPQPPHTPSLSAADLQNPLLTHAASSISEGYDEVEDDVNTEVVYVKENVWVWPERSARIMGRLTLTVQHHILFLSWLPYAAGTVNSDGTFQAGSPPDEGGFQNRTRYAIRATVITDIEAITRHTPLLGCHYMVLNMRTGTTLAPLHFQNGGIKTLMSVLKQHVSLAKMLTDPNTYVVMDGGPVCSPPLDVTDGADVMMGAPPRNADSTIGPRAPVAETWPDTSGLHLTLEEDPWLGKSLIALAAMENFADRSAKKLHRFFFPDDPHPDEIEQELSMNTAMRDLIEKGPLNRARRLRNQEDFGRAAEAKVEREQEQRVVKSSHALSLRQATTDVGVFEIIDQSLAAPSRRRSTPALPLGTNEWASFLDGEGRINDAAELRRRVYSGGVAPELRREIWKFLLGVYPMNTTAHERAVILTKLRHQYNDIKSQWESISPKQAQQWSKWRERKSQIDKDVARTDRDSQLFLDPDSIHLHHMQQILLSYVMYNQDLGYSQGMSDLLAPVVSIMRDEAESFWAFVALMDHVGGNFDTDQRCCQLQLGALRQLIQLLDPPLHEAIKTAGCLDYLCCFRWIMVLLKREFPFDEVPRLWEVLWTNPLSPHLHIYISVVMLEYRRTKILEDGLDCGRMHQLCSSLKGTMKVNDLLDDAEALCKFAGDAGIECLSEVPLQNVRPK